MHTDKASQQESVLAKANNMPQVYWAIEHGQYDTLERLIDNGVDVEMLIDDGCVYIEEILAKHKNHPYVWTDMTLDFESFYSPLALAAYRGRDSMVKLLLDNGAAFNTERESTSLCDCCDLLLRCAEYLPDSPEFWEHNNRLDFHRLMQEGGIYDSWWYPLHYAICQGHVSIAKLLIERGADTRNLALKEKVTALHVATRHGVEEMIDYLLGENLVDINSQTDFGVTALHLAYIDGNYDLVDAYLDHGADINLAYTDESGPWTIFAMACAAGDFDRALQYLEKGANPRFVITEDNNDRDAWTAMRFTYGNDYPNPDRIKSDDARVRLEQAIIARGGEESTSDA